MSNSSRKISFFTAFMLLIAACSSATSPPTQMTSVETHSTEFPVPSVSTSTDTVIPVSSSVPTQTLISGNIVALPNNSCIYSDEDTRIFVFLFQFAQFIPLDHSMRALVCFDVFHEPVNQKWWVLTTSLSATYGEFSMVGVALGVLDDPSLRIRCVGCSDYVVFDRWQPLDSQDDTLFQYNFPGLKKAALLVEQGVLEYSGDGNAISVP